MDTKKYLIAYFSRPGNNYVGGSIVNLPIGNTEVIAKKIQTLAGGELFTIKTVHTYPEDYTETTNMAKDELHRNFRPEIIGDVSTMEAHDVVFLGYPNWWNTMPMAVFTFLESYDFFGKTIIPFCTHEGSGMGRSERDIANICPGTTILSGLALVGGKVSGTDAELKNWLKKHNLI